MGDLVLHVATVYLHKATSMRTGQVPEPWPPPGLDDEPLLPLLERAYDELMVRVQPARAHRPHADLV